MPSSNPNRDRFNLLVVHGHPAVAKLLGHAARATSRFRSIRSMANGRFALEWMLERLPFHSFIMPDLIVLDLRLPGLNGVQFTRELRRANPSRDTLVAFLATSAAPEDQDAAETAGADFFLRRPDSVAAVADVLTMLARRIETQRDYARLDAHLAAEHYGCAMLSDNVV